MALDETNKEDLADVLETVQEMRSNNGDLEIMLPQALLPDTQRGLEDFVRDMREFGYALQTGRDAAGRITRVTLLDQ